jgi:Transposase zinc-ribbon domain
MPTLSHVHQLFGVETSHAYIHALRWKDRPFRCPHCHSPEVGPWDTYHY